MGNLERRLVMTKILVVDDDPQMHELLTALLSIVGRYTILKAGDGREAQAVLPDDNPDLVITDFNMPGMTGIELVRWIKEKYPGIPVILMSNQNITLHPADIFMNKGDLFDKLHPAIERLLKETKNETAGKQTNGGS
jgi:CheY-like chemotaxis protein